MKLTNEKIREFASMNENGFKVNLQKLINPFAYGDEYPQFQKVIYNDDEKQVNAKISFFKFNGGSAEYKIEINEYKKKKDSQYMIGGSGCFNKDLYIEELPKDKARFNIKHLIELCHKITEEEIQAAMQEYEMKIA